MKHGTLTAYMSHACRCDECRTVAVRHHKRYRLAKQRGVVHLVDVQPMRDHVASLIEQGMSFRAITLAAGWKSRNSLEESLRRDRVLVRTFNRVMAVRPDTDTRPMGYVDATGARRRLQALAVNGWPSRALANHLGHSDHSTILDIQSGANVTCRRYVADAIARLFDELWDQPGPAPRARTRALSKGWAPPLAWDEDAIDDAKARPNGIGQEMQRARARWLREHEVAS